MAANVEDYSEVLLSFGNAVEDQEFLNELQFRLWSELLQRPTRNLQFPGSQPVSFARQHLDALEREDYYVCEKSDGVRYLLYYTSPYGRPTAYLIDRNFNCRELSGLTCPGKMKGTIHTDTLLDGELIYERSSDGGAFHFLIFDALLISGANIMRHPLPRRLQYVQNDVVAPLKAKLQGDVGFAYPFKLDMKSMSKPYAIAQILELEIPQQQHGNDGLIFTPVSDPYISGTCERLLKWKPSELNSVDFKLIINAKASAGKTYELHVASRDSHRFFGYHRPDEKLDQFDQTVIECRYCPDEEEYHWEYIRNRLDKNSANYERVVDKIVESIKDNVTSQELIERIPAIRRAWKAREARGVKEVRGVREVKEIKEVREVRGVRDPRDNREVQDPRDNREV
ncbi:mRNA-capping enzyme subunit alpha, partial [Paramicrosporidium saccamoebae]